MLQIGGYPKNSKTEAKVTKKKKSLSEIFQCRGKPGGVAQPQLITQDTTELVTSGSMRKQAEYSNIK